QFSNVFESYGRFENGESAQLRNAIDKVRSGDGTGHAPLPISRFRQIIKQDGDQLIRRNKLTVGVNHAESVAVAVSRQTNHAFFRQHQFPQFLQVTYFRFRRTAAEKNVAPIVNRLDAETVVPQKLVEIATTRSPEWVVGVMTAGGA